MRTARKIAASALLLICLATLTASADPFSPTLLKLTADSAIMYDFDTSELTIPVEVRGTPARVIFCLFTKNKDIDIGQVTNGYLGWHYVNKVDTCIYYSTPFDFDPGVNLVTWSGQDQDGNIVPAGKYTYYMWAFDNVGNKVKMMNVAYTGDFQAVDATGAPLANPIYHRGTWRWTVGDDPLDDTLRTTTSVAAITDWCRTGAVIDPHDLDYVYFGYQNDTAGLGSIMRYKYVAGGDAELDTSFGDEGFGDTFSRGTGGSIGVGTDGEYLYTGDENHVDSSEPDAQFYIYDYDGHLVDTVDLTPWWSDQKSYDAGAQMNGGPNSAFVRHGKVFLNCHCSCLNQMVDPKRYLETHNPDDFFVWSNGNGDITGDHNFEDTAILKWICMDYNVGPYKYTMVADDNLFSMFNAYDAGAVSFGMYAPDGTGLGYFRYAGETAGWKRSTKIIDAGTPFDGLYPCNRQIGGTHWYDPNEASGTWFIGHDSISGIITAVGCWGVLRLLNDFNEAPLIGGTDYDIFWYSTIGPRLVYLEFSSDGGATWSVIADSIDADLETCRWTVPDIVSDHCLLRISETRPFICGYQNISNEFSITDHDTAVDGVQSLSFIVDDPSPNPFNPSTTIRFTLPARLNATVAVYNIAGQRVTVLHDGILDSGSHALVWDAAGCAAGVYFCTVEAGTYRETVKMTLAK